MDNPQDLNEFFLNKVIDLKNQQNKNILEEIKNDENIKDTILNPYVLDMPFITGNNSIKKTYISSIHMIVNYTMF